METRICQNCKKDFVIKPDDFSFYEKMKVPAPTFCPTCRMQRRFMFRNERMLYKGKCDLCHQPMISIFSPDKPYKVFCSKCWWSDDWDCGNYYLDYDPNKNFFEQLKELQLKTPFMDKIVSYLKLINSDYINHASTCKNCYLMFNADDCENVYHSATVVGLKDSADCLFMNNTELSYGCVAGDGSRIYFSDNCPGSINVWYSKDCVGCNDCFGCVNLRKKSYHIFNEPYTKEEYNKEIVKMELDKYSTHLIISGKIYNFWKKFPRRYMYGRMNKNTTGDYIYFSKNTKACYQAIYMEDVAYCQFITMPTFRDCYDISEWGNGAELCIDSVTIGEGVSEVKYCSGIWSTVRNTEYSMYVINSKNCFGCMNLRNKEYCILNKQYTKEEYFSLRDKIIDDLGKNPYIDNKGRIWKYGEFMPYDLSLFAYNESFAQQYFPLEKWEIKDIGFNYIESDKSDYKATIKIKDIPDSIHNINDNFIKEIINCNCGKFYRIVAGELQLLKRFNIPIPRKCPDCRHMDRMKRLNPPFLYNRNCDKCDIDIETSYAPNRPEIVYCEKCYQQEVM